MTERVIPEMLSRHTNKCYWLAVNPIKALLNCNLCARCSEPHVRDIARDARQEWTFFEEDCLYCGISHGLERDIHVRWPLHFAEKLF